MEEDPEDPASAGRSRPAKSSIGANSNTPNLEKPPVSDETVTPPDTNKLFNSDRQSTSIYLSFIDSRLLLVYTWYVR